MKPVWIELAEKELGVKEIRGGEAARIIEYHRATKLAATEDEIAWCSSFMNWVMKKCGRHRTYSASARSWLQKDAGKQLDSFKEYAIVVFKRGNSSWQGHVTFAIKEDATRVYCLGGNQGDKVGYSWYSKSKVLGYVWPVELPKVKTA